MISFAILALSQSLVAQLAEPVRLDGFKIVFQELDLKDRVIVRGEMIALGGRVYVFRNSDKEIQIHDPKLKTIELIDLGRKVRSRVLYARLDSSKARLEKAIERSIAKKLATGVKHDELIAKMTRNLIEPAFVVTRDEAKGSSRLVNANVEIDAKGTRSLDAARLAVVAEVLRFQVGLQSERYPTKIPPFPRLEALRELTETRRLLPTEIKFVYRLTGEPFRERYTYEFVPELSRRERDAIPRIIELERTAPFLTFDAYEGLEQGKSKSEPAEDPGK
ncbi:MAG: hypothetical protein SFX72_00665 [Isosphaeraceae bacterium]|nr:hypothetical protein [Isosphaeraceae bacterium]